MANLLSSIDSAADTLSSAISSQKEHDDAVNNVFSNNNPNVPRSVSELMEQLEATEEKTTDFFESLSSSLGEDGQTWLSETAANIENDIENDPSVQDVNNAVDKLGIQNNQNGYTTKVLPGQEEISYEPQNNDYITGMDSANNVLAGQGSGFVQVQGADHDISSEKIVQNNGRTYDETANWQRALMNEIGLPNFDSNAKTQNDFSMENN